MELNTGVKPLIIIGGPTGSGKSDAALDLAEKIGGEIISADSVAVYRGMDIGSAKPSKKDLKRVAHHLINILDPDEYFGVNEFVARADKAAKEIYSRDHIPIVTGGTAFYIRAFLYGASFEDEVEHDTSYRDELYAISNETGGMNRLHDMLKELDPEYAVSVHMNNVKRVIRALEYIRFTGRKFSEYNAKQAAKPPCYNFCFTALDRDRNSLYKAIDARVDRMIQEGLVDEVKRLLEMGYDRSLKSMSSIGYKETADYLSGECGLDTAIYKIKLNTRHYAKRQLTWLRREKDVHFIESDSTKGSDLTDTIMDIIKAEPLRMDIS